MSKVRVRKDIAEQMTSKLKTLKNENIKPEFVEKLQKSALNSQNEQITSKLQANKNVFSRGDFDEYKISDEELKELEFIEKSNIFPIGHITEHPDGSLSQKVAIGKWIYLPYNIKDLADKQTGDDERDKKRAREILERMNLAMQAPIIKKINPIQVPNGNERFLANYLKPYLDKIDNEIQSGNLRCRANGKTVVQFLRTHCYKNKNGVRKGDDLQSHAGYLPFVIPLIKKYGITDKSMNRPAKNGATFIELVGRADIVNPNTNKKERVGISVVLVTLGNKTSMLKDISVFKIVDKYNLIKSFQHNSMDVSIASLDMDRNALSSPHAIKIIPQQNNLSSKDVTKSLAYSGHKLQGRAKLYGMDISIENKKGSYRSGVDKDGHKWRTYMHYDYGYIRGTVGVDKDHVDAYVGPDKNAEKVYVIHQNDPVTHKYDEDKCMLCFASAEDAKKAYMKQYDRPGFYGSMTIMTIDEFKSFIFSHKGKMVHKSFDINITDITDNNKQQKLEQVNKALNAIVNNQPFMIKHIPADASTSYGNLLVRITDFDRSKIEKAVHKIALSLDSEIKAGSKGETFVYHAQEEITDKFFNEFTTKTRAIYNFVISYFDLPDIRIVSKAGELKHKGKILYNPSTGLPIKESEWKQFVVELEKFLNRNYTGIGEKIVLSAESLGIILDRLSKTNSFEAVRKMSLSEMKAKRYDVDWIGDSIKNMKDKFGDVISRERQARIQIAIDSAAQRVTRVKDDMRNNIQQIIIDGIRDKQSKSVVAQNLFDKCASLNRDMQRIADSEVQMAATSSYIKEEVYNTPANEKVYFKRFEVMDDNTCKNCRKINGKVVLWSDVALPDEHIKDEIADIAIWEGKTGGLYPETILHPWCYSDDTEVMTNNGWKLFKDVEKNDKIMSINPETQEIDFVPFVKQVQYEYNGKMIHFPGRNFDLLVTPDHNMLYVKQNGKLEAMKAKDLIKNDFINLPRAIGKWEKTDTKTIKFGDLTISKAQYFRLWAWYLAEGNGRCRDGCYEVKLAQKEPMKIYNDLPDLQKVLHVESDSVCFFGDYARYFECMFGIYADKKFIPSFIKNSSADNIREFLDAFIMADGTHYKNAKCSSKKAYSDVRNEQVLRTSSKKMADDLCELIVKAGWLPSENINHCKGKLVHFKNGDYELNTDCYNISICHSKTRTYAPDIPGHLPRHNPIEVDYKGMVYDVELEKWHFLLVRRNGKCAWSGNCRGAWIRYYPEV